MRHVAVIAVLVSLCAATSAGFGAKTASGSLAPASCVGLVLHYGDQGYRPVVLSQPRGKLGLRLRRPLVAATATLADHSNCIDAYACVVNEPCVPPEQPPPLSSRKVRLARLVGIRPSLALADRDNPRMLYLSFTDCQEHGNGKRLVRCLRSQSRY